MEFFRETIAVTAQEPIPGGTFRYWITYPSLRVANRWNNFALVSCGWYVGHDLPRSTFQRLRKREITFAEWNK